jgi:hypothetical protein
VDTIRPGERSAIRLFLQSLASWHPDEIGPDYVYEERRQWANIVLRLIGQDADDLEMMALESLEHATIALCESPDNADVIARFHEAGQWLLEIVRLDL